MSYNRIVKEKIGFVLITKNGQVVNYHADCGDPEVSKEYYYIDKEFMLLVAECGYISAIYERDISILCGVDTE